MESAGWTRTRGDEGQPGVGVRLAWVLAVLAALGIGALVLNRWIAGTRDGALILTLAWFLAVGGAVLWMARGRPVLTRTLVSALGLAAIGGGAIAYWTGFRDTEVSEQVVTASGSSSGVEREAALAGGGSDGSGPGGAASDVGSGRSEGKAKRGEQDSKGGSGAENAGPVSLLEGGLQGADGHDATGDAEVIKDGNDRALTFTDFEVDPGPGVEVYLTPKPGEVSDRIELGGLKGTKGDQQYSIPGDANLKRYDTVVIYCVPFTTRMAVAELS